MLHAKCVVVLALFMCCGRCQGVSLRAYRSANSTCDSGYTPVSCQSNNESDRDYNCVPTCSPGFVFKSHDFPTDGPCPSVQSIDKYGTMYQPNAEMPWLFVPPYCSPCDKGQICNGSPDRQFCAENLTSSRENSERDGCRCKIGTLLSDGTCDETCDANSKLYECGQGEREQHCFPQCDIGHYAYSHSCDIIHCKPCSPGSFCINDDYNHCPNYMRSPLGSTSFSNCTCHGGHVRHNDICLVCPEGSFCDAEVQHECPNGTTSREGSREENDCYCKDGFSGGGSINCLVRNNETRYRCDDGFVHVGGDSRGCQPCRPGDWCEPSGGQIHQCPDGLFSPYASSSKQSCICRQGYQGSECTSVVTFTSRIGITYTRFTELEADFKIALCASSGCTEQSVHFSVVEPPVESRRQILASDDTIWTYVVTIVNTAGDVNATEMFEGITNSFPGLDITISNITSKTADVAVTTPVAAATGINRTLFLTLVGISCSLGFCLTVTVIWFILNDHGLAYTKLEDGTMRKGSMIAGVKIGEGDIEF